MDTPVKAAAPPRTATGGTIAQELATFAAGFALERIPQQTRERARYLILDALGVALASTQYDFAPRILAGIQAVAGDGSSTVVGFPARLPLRDAALMNGALVHGIDFDDTHVRAIVHPTASAFICAFGVAEQLNLTGREMLAAYVLGIETVTRICDAAKGHFHDLGFHPTGIAAHFSCALQAGWLYGLTREQLTMAQGLMVSTASGSQEFLEEGAWNKRMHPGWAAVAGITAAHLARCGYVGPTKPYEGRFGLYRSHLGHLSSEVDYGAITRGLGEVWEVHGVAVKPFPICHLIHACADSGLVLREKYGLRAADIAKMEALLPQPTLHIVAQPVASKVRPANEYDAKFSTQFVVAACIVRGRFGLVELRADALNDAEILALAAKVECVADPESTYPQYFSGGLVVTTTDGRVLRHHESVNRGAGERALSNREIEEKFMANALLAVPRSRAENIRDLVLDMEQHTARDLAAALCGH
jgi:2-methylcitrate dehydratase PrpD